jgi:hypothetical protein
VETLVTVPRYQVGRILLAAAGFPHDQFEAEYFVLRFRSVLLTQPFKEQLGRSPAQFAYGLVHHGEARVQQGGELGVVEVNYRLIPRDLETCTLEGSQHSDGRQAVDGQESGRRVFSGQGPQGISSDAAWQPLQELSHWCRAGENLGLIEADCGEPTSGLEPLTCPLRVCGQWLLGAAHTCKSRIDKGFCVL